MRYQPSLPGKNNNITQTHPLKEFATLLGGMLVFLLLIYILLGFMVDTAVKRISPELETEIFSHIPFNLLTTDGDSPDPRQAKLQQLTDQLRACLNINRAITVHIKESDTINAVALPGGHIVVFTGLLDMMETENGLSFILAHELGHFKNRDHLRGLGRGLVLMAMATTFTGPNSSLTRLLTPTMQLGQAQYSQNREAHADETGLNGLQCHYGHVGGASHFFEIMAEKQDPDTFSHYFTSHPEMQTRIKALDTQAQNQHYLYKKTIPLSFQD